MNCYTFMSFGGPAKTGTTNWRTVDIDYVNVDGQLIHKAFVFPIETIELYKEAAAQYNELERQKGALMHGTLNKLRGNKM